MNDLGIAGPSPYRDPRTALGQKPGPVRRPPGSIQGIGDLSPAPKGPMLPVGQATELGTAKPIADPRTAYGRTAPSPASIPGLGVRPMAPGYVPPEFVGSPAAASIAAPPQGIAAPPPVAPQPSRLAAARGAIGSAVDTGRSALNSAIPSRNLSGPMSAVGKVAAGAVKLAGKSNLPLTVGTEGLLAGRDILTPGMTGIDQIGRVAEGAGRIGGAGVGALTGAALGGLTGPLAPVVSPLLGIAGGAAGYFAPDAANKAFNFVTGGDNQLSSDRAAQLRSKSEPLGIAAPPPKPIPAGNSRAEAGRGFVNPPPALAGGIADIYTRDGNSFTDGSASGSKSGYGVSTVGTDAAAVARGAASDRELTALRASVANVNDATPGLGGFRDSATEERNARLARQNPLDRLESAARLASSGRERSTALSAYGQLAGTQDQGTTQRGIADTSNLGQTIRASARDRTDLARERMGNSVAMRGQDIGATTRAASDRNSLAIATLQGINAEKVANITSDGRIEAQANRNLRPTVVDQGWEPYTDPQTNLTTMRKLPAKVIDQYGNDITPRTSGKGGIGDPKPTPPAEYMKMPKGARYVGPDGLTYVKA